LLFTEKVLRMPGDENPRSQHDRDVTTIEIGYGLLSALFLAFIAFGAIAGPAFVWNLPGWLETYLPLAGVIAAGILAIIRIGYVLIRYERLREYLKERNR
jgi:hypothetical protein